MMAGPVGCGVRRAFFVVGIAALCGAGSPASAETSPRWQSTPYNYVIVDQDVREVLVEFGRNMKMPVKIATSVGGQRIRGPLVSKPVRSAGEFLQTLCNGYGLVWYFDGTVLHISGEDEVATELIKLNQTSPDEVMRRLKDLGLSDPRFGVKVAGDGSMLSVAGPPAFRTMVRKAVSTLQHTEIVTPAREVGMNDSANVRVFRGGS